MNNKKLSLKIFILPYVCTSIFLFYFFKTASKDFLEFALIYLGLSSVYLISNILCLNIYKKNYKSTLNFIFLKSLKITTMLSIIYIIVCFALFVLNFFIKAFPVSEMLISLTALLCSILPLTLLLFAQIIFFRIFSALKNKNIKLSNPDSLEDIYGAQILIIDNFHTFSNTDTIKALAEHKKIILVSDLNEHALRLNFKTFLANAVFYDASHDELPNLKSNIINVYPSADIFSVLRLVKLLNKSFIIVSEQELSTLCCKISPLETSDINIHAKDIKLVYMLIDSVNCNFNNYKKCVTYQITLSLAKIICTFLCIFLCSSIPFTPVMLIFANLICDILPMLAFVFDTLNEKNCITSTKDCLSRIILDSMLLGVVSFIVFMLASISFSHSCARIICINTYIISSLLYAINLRSERSVFFIGILTNKITNLSFLSGISATVIFTLLICNNASEISFSGWLLISAMALIPFTVNQIQKAVISFFDN